MRIKMATCLTVLVILLGLTGCSDNTLKPDTPMHTAYLLKLSLDSNDYTQFNNLFSQGRKNSISQEQFKSLEKSITAGAEYTNYQLVTFDNGEMLLIRLTPDKDNNGNYYVEDVKMVPQELKALLAAK